MPKAPKPRSPKGLNLDPNPLVDELVGQLGTTGPPQFAQQIGELGAARAYAESPDVPELVTFVGYLGATITHPRTATPDDFNQWCVLYLDMELRNWLLVERAGIVRRLELDDASTTEDSRDVIWVKADAAVGRASGSQSSEAQFLNGDFTRAGDFGAAPNGGTGDASTGVFCEGRTPGCCQGCTYRTRR